MSSTLRGYALTVITVTVALILRLMLDPWLGDSIPYITLFCAVVLATWAWGPGPGLLSLLLGSVCAMYWLLPPRESFWISSGADQLGLLLFILLSLGMLAMVDRLRGERDRSRAQQQALERETAARERSEAVFTRLADANVVGIGIGDSQGRIFYLNDEMLRLMGRTRAEFEAGRLNWLQVQSPQSMEVSRKALKQLASQGRASTVEKEFMRPDGGRTPYLSAKAALGMDDLHVSVALDLTAHKQAEDELREAARRKDEFLAMLAHELRNPLAPIRSCLDLLSHPHTPPEARQRALAIMRRQLAHLVRLVDDLLDASRMTRGQVQLQCRRLVLSEVLHTAVDISRPAIEAGAHHFTLNVAPGLEVDGDETRLAQVFANLLNNAAKYTPAGGHIALSCAAHDRQAVVRVQDDGAGIAQDMLSQVFDLFVQADCPLERQGGLGIGLTLVKRLVELHGGQVQAESAGAGQGSTFTVRLPLAPASETVFKQRVEMA